jgi:hypothetical protein
MNTNFGGGGTTYVSGGTTNVSNYFTNSYAGPAISAGSTSASSGTLHFADSNNVSFGMAGSVVTASASNYVPEVYYACPPWQAGAVAAISNLTLAAVSKRPLFFPFQNFGNLPCNELHWQMSHVTNGSNEFTVQIGIYSNVNSAQISLIESGTRFFVNSAAGYTIPGMFQYEVAVPNNASRLTPGQYVLGLQFDAASTSAMNHLLIGDATLSQPIGVINEGSNTYITHLSHQGILFWGRYTATSSVLPASVGLSEILGGASGTNMPMPVYFTLGNHVG